jgi:PPP family 3-phenylpropionic acid transporter
VRIDPQTRLSFRRVQAIIVGNPRIAGILVFVILYETPFALGMYVLSPFMIQDELGAGTDVQAICASIGALVEIPFFLLGDYFIRRIGTFRCLFIACVFNIVRWVGVFFATEPWHIVALSLLHSVTFGMFYFSVVRYINSHADLRLKASSQTLLGIVYYGVSTTLSTFIGTWLLEEMMLSVRDCYLIVAVLASITLVYLSCFWWTEKRWAPAPTLEPGVP